MNWTTRRRFIILLIIGAIVVAFLTVVSVATFYKTPSCSDNTQNQGETGVDCGGACAYLCTEQQQPPTVLFTKTLQDISGRIDVIAKVENKNTNAAAKNVPYKIALYDANQSLIKEVSGVLDLPPATTVPVYMPGITSGKQTVTRAFLTIDSSSPRWFSMSASERSVPLVSNTMLSGSTSTPRIDAILTNPTVHSFTDVQTIVLVHGAEKEVIAASQTIVPVIPAQGRATATFTWNSAFSGTPASIEVVLVTPL